VIDAHESCPGLACFELLGRKWTPQIVWALLDGPKRFSALLELVGGLSDKMLSRRLSELEEAGIVTRTQYAEIPPRVEYALTPAGTALRRVIVEMERWSTEQAPAARSGAPVPGEAR
jgi:DNA-binding HxlR family transcriptional regulator